MNKEFATKRAELTRRGLAAFITLALAMLSCVGGGGDSDAVKTQRAYDATATFGAEQFEIQLTAIQEEAEATQGAYYATATYGSEQFSKQLTAIAGTQQAEKTPTP